MRKAILGKTDADRKLLEMVLKPCELGLDYLEVRHRVAQGTARRRDMLALEVRRMKFYWPGWNPWYQLYKLIRLPVFFIFPPRSVIRFLEFYSRNSLFRFRRLLFPD